MWRFGNEWMGFHWWGDSIWFGPLSMIFWLIIVAIIIIAVVWLTRAGVGAESRTAPPSHSSALDVLEQRYARGEINREEYLQKKQDIAG